LGHKIAAYGLVGGTVAGILGTADYLSTLSTNASASAEGIKGHVNGVITGSIIVTSGNNLRTSPTTTPDVNTPGNSSVSTGNIYTGKPIPKGQVFKSDYAEQITDDKGNIWFGMPVGKGFVYTEVSAQDTVEVNNVTVNGSDALETNPNMDLSLEYRDGSIQLINAQGQAQHVPEATFLSSSQV